MRAVAPGPSSLPQAKAGSSAEGFTAAEVGALAAAAAASATAALRERGQRGIQHARPESAVEGWKEAEELTLAAHVASAGRRRDRRRLRADRRQDSLPTFPSEMDPEDFFLYAVLDLVPITALLLKISLKKLKKL